MTPATHVCHFTDGLSIGQAYDLDNQWLQPKGTGLKNKLYNIRTKYRKLQCSCLKIQASLLNEEVALVKQTNQLLFKAL